MRLSLRHCGPVLYLLCGCFTEAAPAPPLPQRPKPQVAAKTTPEPEPIKPAEPSDPPVLPVEVPPATLPAASLNEPKAAEEPLKPRRPSDPLLGDIRCKFDDYPPMRCTISKKGASYWLEKTQGSQRIRGTLTKEGEGLVFQGEFFCPMGACTSSARASLRKTDTGWAGTIFHDQDGTPMRTPLVLSR